MTWRVVCTKRAQEDPRKLAAAGLKAEPRRFWSYSPKTRSDIPLLRLAAGDPLQFEEFRASILLATNFGRCEMPTLVLRNVPDDLYKRLKETAAEHRRSMTQEAIVSLRTALEGLEEPPARPGLDETVDWLRREVWSLPVLDQRGDDDILGYNEHGHFD